MLCIMLESVQWYFRQRRAPCMRYKQGPEVCNLTLRKETTAKIQSHIWNKPIVPYQVSPYIFFNWAIPNQRWTTMI